MTTFKMAELAATKWLVGTSTNRTIVGEEENQGAMRYVGFFHGSQDLANALVHFLQHDFVLRTDPFSAPHFRFRNWFAILRSIVRCLKR